MIDDRRPPALPSTLPPAATPHPDAWIRAAEPGEADRLRGGRPRVSIVTPSFNQGQYLERTIRSVLDQGYADLEYIVIDGGSTDDSVAIIERYADRIDYWISEPDAGQTDALNKGFARATGDIVAWLNSDDVHCPGAIATAVAAFAAEPALGFVYGRGNRLDADGTHIGEFEYTRPFDIDALIHGIDYIPQPTVFMRRQALHEVGPFNRHWHYAFDWELWMRLGKRFPARMLDARLAGAHQHATIKTLLGGFTRSEEIRQIVEQHTATPLSVGALFYYATTVLQELPRTRIAEPARIAHAVSQVADACFALVRDNRFCHDLPPPSGPRAESLPYPDGWVPHYLRLLRPIAADATVVCLQGYHEGVTAAVTGPLVLKASIDGQPLGTVIIWHPGAFTACWPVPAPLVVNRAAAEIEIHCRTTATGADLGLDEPRALSFRFRSLTFEADAPSRAVMSTAAGGGLTNDFLAARRQDERTAPVHPDGWAGPEVVMAVERDAADRVLCVTGYHDERIAALSGSLTLWASADGEALGGRRVAEPGPFTLSWPLPANGPGARTCNVRLTSVTGLVPSRFWATEDRRVLTCRLDTVSLRPAAPIESVAAVEG